MTSPARRIDPNGVQAGKYELVDLFWDRLITKPGDPGHPVFERVYQGDVVDLDQADAQRLVRAGSAIPEGEREQRQAALAEARFRLELSQLSPETQERVLSGLKKSAVPEGLEAGEVFVQPQDSPGFQAPTNAPALRANAQGDGGPDPQTGKAQETVQEEAISVSDAVPAEQATQEHTGASQGRRGNRSGS